MRQRTVVPVVYLCLIVTASCITIQNSKLSSYVPTKKAAEANKLPVADAYGKLPLSFEVNRGQTESQVRFLSRGSGYTLFLTSREAVLRFSGGHIAEGQTQPVHPAVLRMAWSGANTSPEIAGVEELPGDSNYFIGHDPSQWRTNIPSYAKVKYHNVYPGVDLIYYGNQRQLEYDLVVAPGTTPRDIRLDLQGTDHLAVDAQGDVVVGLNGREVRLQKPLVYQETKGGRREIYGRYVIEGDHQVGFDVAAYDMSSPLVIDPVLVYSTYLGGSANDSGNAIAVDVSGNAYVTGSTGSANFPTLTPLQASLAGGGSDTDVFVAKLNASGTALVYSTYLGGGNQDQGNSIAVDSSGNVYVTGSTLSTNFPTTPGAAQTALGGVSDAFVAKLNSTGTALSYSTYLGGNTNDGGNGIAVDASGNAYVTGSTNSTNFPTTAGAFQTTFGGSAAPPTSGDAFVTKLNVTGSVSYSTYLGGGALDYGMAIALDASGNAYVTGSTQSNNFPTTPGAVQTFFAGSSSVTASIGDAFVTKLNSTGASLVYSTYLGGNSGDVGNGIAVDASGNAYVAGSAQSTNFPVLNSFQAALAGSQNVFISKVNPTGATLSYSTYLGGSGADQANGIAIDSSGNAYVTGATSSTNFPVTTGAFQVALAGGVNDAFVAQLNGAGSTLVYSTYLGGSGDDKGLGIAVDASGNAYVAGNTGSSNLPVVSPIQATLGGGLDAFVAKIGANNPLPALTSLSPSSATAGSAGFTLTVNGANFVAGAAVQWNGAPRSTTFVSSTQLTASIPSGDIAAVGTAQVSVVDPSPGGGPSNSLTFTIVASGGNLVPTLTSLSPTSATAGGGSFILTASGQNFVSGSVVLWNGGSRPTTFVSGTQLTATISASDIAATGTAQVTVFNPAPGGGTSNGLSFAINNSLPALTGMTPAFAVAGGAQFILTVTGTGFASNAVVNWNGSARTTTFVSNAQLTASITAGDIAAAGTASVTVSNPGPGGGVSNALTFSIVTAGNNPVPMIISLAPSAANAGGAAFSLTVNGLNFIASSSVQWNGSIRPTTFVSSTQVTATIPASDISASGTALVTVFTPAPGGGTSNAATFTINPPGFNPVPIISGLSPSGTVAGSGGFTLTVNGSNFVAGAVVQWNGSARPTSFASSTQLQATISASDVALANTVLVTVINPAPGGGTSNAVAFTISAVAPNPVPTLTSLSPSIGPAGGASFTLTVNGSNFVAGAVVQWNGAARSTTFVSASQVTASIPASDITAVGTASVTVLNPIPGGGSSNALTFTITNLPIVNVGGTLSAASFSSLPLAPSSLASVFGANFSSTTVHANTLPLPFTLGGATLRINGFAAALIDVSPQQINFQIPQEVAGLSQATITVTTGSGTSSPVTINLANFNPGLFATNQQGSGQGAVLIANTASVAAPLGAFPGSRPAIRGEFISIFCTGLGAVTNQPADGVPASGLSFTTTAPTVNIGGIPAQVSFSGLAPDFVGLYQVNVLVPDGVTSNSSVPVVLSIGGVISNTVTIAVQ